MNKSFTRILATGFVASALSIFGFTANAASVVSTPLYETADDEVVDTRNINIYPNPDIELDRLGGIIVVDLEEYRDVGVIAGPSSSARIYDETGKLVAYYSMSVGDSCIIKFKIESPIVKKGLYTIKLYGLVTGLEADIDPIEFTYSVSGIYDEYIDYSVYTLTPDNSVEYASLSGQIKLTFPNINMIDNASGFAVVTADNGFVGGAREFRISMSQTEDNVAFVNISNPLTQPGVYTFEIPYGSIDVADNGEYLPAFSFTYTIAEGDEPIEPQEIVVTVDPEEGEYPSIGRWVVTFPEVEEITIDPDAAQRDYPQLYNVNEDGSLGTIAQLCMTFFLSGLEIEDPDSEIGRNQLEIRTYVKEVNLPGNYALVLPAGKIFLDGEPFAENIAFYYTVAQSAEEAFDYSWTLTPAPEQGVVVNPTEFVIDFEGVSAVEHDPFDNPPRLYYVENGERQREYVAITPITESGTTSTMTINTDWGLTESGTYDLVIPANYYTVTSEDGELTAKTPLIEARYEISIVNDYVGTLSCVRLGDDLAQFEIAFDPAPTTLEVGEGKVLLLDGNFDDIAEGNVEITSDLKAVVTFEVPADVTDGDYTVEVEEGAFIVDGSRNKPSLFDFAYVAISEILSTDELPEIYTLSGVKISPKALRPGIYLINGRKTVVK